MPLSRLSASSPQGAAWKTRAQEGRPSPARAPTPPNHSGLKTASSISGVHRTLAFGCAFILFFSRISNLRHAGRRGGSVAVGGGGGCYSRALRLWSARSRVHLDGATVRLVITTVHLRFLERGALHPPADARLDAAKEHGGRRAPRHDRARRRAKDGEAVRTGQEGSHDDCSAHFSAERFCSSIIRNSDDSNKYWAEKIAERRHFIIHGEPGAKKRTGAARRSCIESARFIQLHTVCSTSPGRAGRRLALSLYT